jgi:hypothetical protein
MAKKIVRLTESDLVKLINRVLDEQTAQPMGDNVKKMVEDCFMQNVEFKDLVRVPTCSAIAMEILKTKKLPSDMSKGMKCANELASAIGDDPFTAFGKLTSIGSCLIDKATKGSPVMY